MIPTTGRSTRWARSCRSSRWSVCSTRSSRRPKPGGRPPTCSSGFAVGIVFGGLFAAWELHTPEPMLDLRFFENPRFSAASVTVTLVTFAVFGSTFLLTQYFQFVLGYSPLKSGLMAMPVAIGMMVAAPNAPRFVFRWGTKRVVVIGIVVTVAGDAAVRVEHGDVVVRRRRRGAAAPRRGCRPHHGAGHRVDHGLAAAREGRGRLRRQRHDPPDRWCDRHRGDGQPLRRLLPPLHERRREAAGQHRGRGARLGRRARSSPRRSCRPRRRRSSSTPRAARSSTRCGTRSRSAPASC